MLLGPERKKAVTVIIAGLGGGGESGDMECDEDYAKKACASKIMRAFETKDVSELCEYLSEFIDMCSHSGPSKREPEEMDY